MASSNPVIVPASLNLPLPPSDISGGGSFGAGNYTFPGTLTITGDATINGMTVGLGGGQVATNVALGNAALPANTTGARNLAIGTQALQTNLTGTNNVGIGFAALNSLSSGTGNIAIGTFAADGLAGGASNNIAIGVASLSASVNGQSNTAVGSGSLNVALGANNIAVGANAGAYETGSNAFYVNSLDRTNTAGDKSLSLMYGIMAAAAANQSLRLNANVGIQGAPTTTSPLNITGLPTSAAGLATGDVWNNAGVLTIH